MNQTEVITAIKEVAKSDKAADAVFHMWATRARARGQVTVEGLGQRMREEGYTFGREDYAKFLRRMADLGFGRLDVSDRGRVRALKDIKIKLQSIGKAAVGTETTLAGWKARNKFRHLPAVKPEGKRTAMVPPPLKKPPVFQDPKPELLPTPEVSESGPLFVVVELGKHYVRIPIPANLTDSEVGILVRRLQN